MSHDVFISHSSQNKKVAEAIRDALEQDSIKCWIAPRDIQPGAKYGEEITRGISECKVFLLVFSKAANASPAVAREVEMGALDYKKIVIPFRIEDTETGDNMKFFLAGVHWLDASPGDTTYANLVTAVKKALGMEIEEQETERTGGLRPGAKPGAKTKVIAVGAILLALVAALALGVIAKRGNKGPLAGVVSANDTGGYITIQGKRYSTALTSLTLTHMGLRNEDIVPLQNMKNLTKLELYSNQISDLTPLSGLKNLAYLYLYSNQISDVTPLSGLTNLTVLDLGNNRISDVMPLSGLNKLTTLNLANNQISDLNPLSDFTSTSLNLQGNPINNWSPLVRVPVVNGRPLRFGVKK